MLGGDPQATLRVSAFRMQKQVDTAPTQTVVEEYLKLLISEADLMIHCRVPGGDPKVEVVSTYDCKHWGTDAGCSRGKLCRFAHDWQKVQDGSQGCWVCSAKSHTSRDCPTKSSESKGERRRGPQKDRKKARTKRKVVEKAKRPPTRCSLMVRLGGVEERVMENRRKPRPPIRPQHHLEAVRQEMKKR